MIENITPSEVEQEVLPKEAEQDAVFFGEMQAQLNLNTNAQQLLAMGDQEAEQ